MRMGMLAAGGWAVAAALTVGVSWTAISVVKESVVPRTDVRSALPTPDETVGPTGTSPAPGPTATAPTTAARTSAAAPVRAFSGQGGRVTVRCVGGAPAFVTLIPQQGYQVRRDDSSPEVEFSSSGHRTEITVSCAGGVPAGSVEEKGGRGRGGGGDDG